MVGLLLQTSEGTGEGTGGGFGLLLALILVAVLFFVLNWVWRRDKTRKLARDRALADRLLQRIYQRPGDPINVRRLARQERIRPAVAREICEGKLIREGYLHRKRRPRVDRVEHLFLSPSGIEAMQRRSTPEP